MLHGQTPDKDLFVGDIIVNAKPIRRRSSKYYVPEYMYGVGLYPNYAGGGGFVMSGHTALRLSSACQQVTQISRYISFLPFLLRTNASRVVLFLTGGVVPHRWRLFGNVPPADWRQAVAPPGIQDLRDLPPVSCPEPSDVRPLFLPRTHGRSQPQRPSDLAHVEPTAWPPTELPQQDQADILAFQVAGRDGCNRKCGDRNCGDGLRREAGLCLTRVILCWVEWNLQGLRAGRKWWWSGICVPTRRPVMRSVARLSPYETISKLADLISRGNELAKAKHASEEKPQKRKRWLLPSEPICVLSHCLLKKKKKKNHTATFISTKGLW